MDDTWANVDLLSVRSSDVHLSAISQEIPTSNPSIIKISLKIIYLKVHSNITVVNELKYFSIVSKQIWHIIKILHDIKQMLIYMIYRQVSNIRRTLVSN